MKTNENRFLFLWSQKLDDLAAPPAAWLDLLDREERAHSDRFIRARDRLSYAAAHALLRAALAQVVGCPADALVFSRDSHGRPSLLSPRTEGLDFSLSHTEGLVAVVISEQGRVGVDVETLNRNVVPRTDYSAYGLSEEETARLSSLEESERVEAFLDLWTAREAVAKADGRGLSLPLKRIRIDQTRDLAEVSECESDPGSRWRLWRRRPSPLHLLTVAGPESSELIQQGVLI